MTVNVEVILFKKYLIIATIWSSATGSTSFY